MKSSRKMIPVSVTLWLSEVMFCVHLYYSEDCLRKQNDYKDFYKALQVCIYRATYNVNRSLCQTFDIFITLEIMYAKCTLVIPSAQTSRNILNCQHLFGNMFLSYMIFHIACYQRRMFSSRNNFISLNGPYDSNKFNFLFLSPRSSH